MTSPKLTIDPASPIAKLTTEPGDTGQVTDGKGRVIKLKKPDMLAQYDMVDILGDRAANQTFLQMVSPLIYVTEVAGEPVFPPESYAEVRALIKLLGEDGVEAVARGIVENFGTEDEKKALAKALALKN